MQYPAECVETLRKAALGEGEITPLETFLCALNLLTFLAYNIVSHPSNVIFGSTEPQYMDAGIVSDMQGLAEAFGVEPPAEPTAEGAMSALPLSGPLQNWFISKIIPIVIDRLLNDEFLQSQLELLSAYIRAQIEDFFEGE